MRAGCLHKSAALLHMFCRSMKKNEWKDNELHGCKKRKSTGGIPGCVDTCGCHLCIKKREGTEGIPDSVSFACTKKRKGIDMTSSAVQATHAQRRAMGESRVLNKSVKCVVLLLQGTL